MLEKTIESPLDSKEIKPVNPEGNQPWVFTGRTDGEAEALILWLPDVKSWFFGKDPDAGKDRRQEKGAPEDEMVGWHHRFNAHEFEPAPGDGEGQGSLVCCSPSGRKASTEGMNNIWSGCQSCRSEPLTCGIWCCLWIDNVRIELYYIERVSSWCQRIAWWHELRAHMLKQVSESSKVTSTLLMHIFLETWIYLQVYSKDSVYWVTVTTEVVQFKFL